MYLYIPEYVYRLSFKFINEQYIYDLFRYIELILPLFPTPNVMEHPSGLASFGSESEIWKIEKKMNIHIDDI